MAEREPKWLIWLMTAFCCCALLAACAKDAQWIRQSTYPPQFRYISEDELASVMWRLAGRVHELERQSELEPPDATVLSTLLDQIESEARRLDSSGSGSNHPYLQSKLPEFLRFVARARLDLQRTPPQIASVDDVWRACAECHAGS